MSNKSIFIGIDLALSSTAFYIKDLDDHSTNYYYMVPYKKKQNDPHQVLLPDRSKHHNEYLYEFERLQTYINFLLNKLFVLYKKQDIKIIAVEGLSNGSISRKKNEIGFMHYMVTYMLHINNFNVLVIPPTVMKKYITGKGNAKKEKVYEVIKDRYNLDIKPSRKSALYDIYDAIGLEIMAEGFWKAKNRKSWMYKWKINCFNDTLLTRNK